MPPMISPDHLQEDVDDYGIDLPVVT